MKKKTWKILKEIYDWSLVFLIALVASLFIKNTVVASAEVPTGSMEETVMTGSRIFINRLAYVSDNPQRGDIVAFTYPDDGKSLYLKRIMGLPGEVIEGRDSKIYINGVQIQDYVENSGDADFGPYEIPENCYFMMGDNRNNSWDSRYWNNKFVEREAIMGKVSLEYFPEIKVLE